jgi:putative peptidoglycan lipid II flippase
MLFKHFSTISFYTALSRISGFARDILIAKYIGAGAISDAFFIALRVPNFFRRFFAEGAFNSAFIPLFSRKLEVEGKEKAHLFAEQIFAFMFIALLIFSAVFMLFMPYLIYLIAPGISDDPQIKNLTIDLTRITFPYLMLISIATIFAAILNSISKFSAVAFMPVLFNAAIVFFLVVLGNKFESLVHAMAWGVFAAGVLQVIWMLYFLQKNKYLLRLKISFLKMNDDIREFLRKVTPAAIGGGVVQINLWIDLMIASFFTGAVTYLYYADRIAQLPLSIIATAMGTALLPMLSKKLASGDIENANNIHEKGLEIVLLLTIPAAIALIILPFDIMNVLFVRGEFTAADANASAYAMAAFAIGLPAFALIKIFSSCFFALKDTKTPVISAVIAMTLNIILNLIFVFTFPKLDIMPHIGIALATALAGWFNALYLAKKLFHKTSFKLSKSFRARIIKILFSVSAMALILIFSFMFLKTGLFALMLQIALSMLVYFGCIILFKTFSLDEIRPYLPRKLGGRV